MFTNIPNNFSSLWGELPYEYNITDSTNFIIEIIESSSRDILGVKKFYSSSSAKLNLAPLLFETMLPDASQLQFSTTITAACGFPAVALSDTQSESERRTFSYARGDVSPYTFLTSMPGNRLLYDGECDIITLLAPSETTLSYSISGIRFSDRETVEISSGDYTFNTDALHHYIVAESYSEEYCALYYTLYEEQEAIATYNYTLMADYTSGYRVAWISSMGSIEHYTFPVIEEQSYLSSGATVKTLRSAYGTATEIEALSEILSSPRVWRVDADEYTLLEVITTEQQIRCDGALMIATIKVQENG
ncbi:MAG: hypothetical protein SNG38_00285 [Rikenellaceae bacterium]